MTDTSAPAILPSGTPLAEYRVIGIQENWFQPFSDAPRKPGGSCWHCGTGIAIEVVIRSTVTGEVHTIGTTCAERVGLDKEGLKRYLDERFAEERALAREMRSKAYREAREAEERAATERFGEHGTLSRYESGCLCDLCIAAAPHGTWHRFGPGNCRCVECVMAAADGTSYTIRDWDVLVDLETGLVAEQARKVDTKYGRSWVVDQPGGGAVWVGIRPARRSTQAKKGYVQASAEYLVEVCGSRYERWYKPVVRLSSPLVDDWDEPLPRPATTVA
jgi:hypothetical protein